MARLPRRAATVGWSGPWAASSMASAPLQQGSGVGGTTVHPEVGAGTVEQPRAVPGDLAGLRAREGTGVIRVAGGGQDVRQQYCPPWPVLRPTPPTLTKIVMRAASPTATSTRPHQTRPRPTTRLASHTRSGLKFASRSSKTQVTKCPPHARGVRRPPESATAENGSPPHARGGAPTPAACSSGPASSSPRSWGCAVCSCRTSPPRSVLPTLVGVRRRTAGRARPRPRPPQLVGVRRWARRGRCRTRRPPHARGRAPTPEPLVGVHRPTPAIRS